MDTRAIGFFDSGLGGASVLREALGVLPGENYIYYGDDGNAPYGMRSEAEIARLTLEGTRFLASRDVKALVIACNTATATCVDAVRAELSIPVISVEPAIKPACSAAGDGKILMLATLATTRLGRYLELCSRMPEPERIASVPCPGFVEMIERGVFEPAAYGALLASLLSPYDGAKVDGIVLGCTHFIFIKDIIAAYAAGHFTGARRFYDGGAATALQLKRVLAGRGLENGGGAGAVEFTTSGDAAHYEPIFRMLLARRP